MEVYSDNIMLREIALSLFWAVECSLGLLRVMQWLQQSILSNWLCCHLFPHFLLGSSRVGALWCGF